MPESSPPMKQVLMEVISEAIKKGPGYFQSGPILSDAGKRLNLLGGKHEDQQQALLTLWYDLFRQGILSPGCDLSNPNPPFCHLTERGRTTLGNLSADPANPDGYMHRVLSNATLSPVCESYLREALQTYNACCYKATAVMVGCAAESLTLELRDAIVAKLKAIPKDVPRDLEDWRIRTVLVAIQRELDARRSAIPRQLREAYEAFWPAFTQQIRGVRNDAGHPSSIDPITADTVHAGLLIFRELAKLSHELTEWVKANFT